MGIKEASPANNRIDVDERTRIPMSTAQEKLSVQEIPGFHLHWMLGEPARIEQALRAGYQFVDYDEVNLVNVDLAGDAKKDGNSDLGTRVSTLANPLSGLRGDDGQPLRLYLMKLPLEWYKADKDKQDERNKKVREALTRGNFSGDSPHAGDLANQYVKHADFSNRR